MLKSLNQIKAKLLFLIILIAIAFSSEANSTPVCIGDLSGNTGVILVNSSETCIDVGTHLDNAGIYSVLVNAGGTIMGGPLNFNAGIGIYTNWFINGPITNYGIIEGGGTGYLVDAGIYNAGYMSNINNFGTIKGAVGIINGGNYVSNSQGISTLNNLQGAGNNAGSLTLSGYLPNSYNIIISSTSAYGQLSLLDNLGGNVNFGIFGSNSIGYINNTLTSSSIVLNHHTYNSVLSGITYSQLISGGTNGNGSTIVYGLSNGITFELINEGSNVWNLYILSGAGPSAADTQASLSTQAQRLRSAFNSTMASGNFANMNTYDCNLFDKNNMCISAGGRYTSIDNPSSNNSAAVVVLGYKVNSNIRIGGFLDQSIKNNTPTGINVSNKNPMMGAFAVWNQNADGLGYQVKIANAYLDKDVTTTRDVIGSSEAGTGKTNLNTQSYVGELSYAFQYQDSTIVRPYFALRYTNIKQDAYTEDTTVSTPLSYAKLGDRSTTALMGVKLNHALTPRTNLTASLGVEQDINHKTDQLVASGVADLTSENFNNNIKRTRPVASAGAYYAVAKNQRLSGEVYYQQLPFQSTGSATAYFNYMIGF